MPSRDAQADTPSRAATVRIIGVDPGSQYTGYGVIDSTGNKLQCVAFGRIRCAAGPLPQRLRQILEELGEVVRTHAPHEAAVEDVFVKANASTALVLGQARGAAICALAVADLPVAEYAPARIKSAVVGSGRADKAQIQQMVTLLLKLEEAPPTDAADALAVALCHAQLRAAAARGQLVTARRRGRSGLRFATIPEVRR